MRVLMQTVRRGGNYLLANYLQQRELTSPGYRAMSFPLAGEENRSHLNDISSANANSITTTRSIPERSVTGLFNFSLAFLLYSCWG